MTTSQLTKLKDWTAKRAGGRITIAGVNVDTGKPQKVVGVDQIAAGTPPVATDKSGMRFALV